MPDIAPIAIDVTSAPPNQAATAKTGSGDEAPFGSILSAEISARRQDSTATETASSTATETTSSTATNPENESSGLVDDTLIDQPDQSLGGEDDQIQSILTTADVDLQNDQNGSTKVLSGQELTNVIHALIFGELSTPPGRANNPLNADQGVTANDKTMPVQAVAGSVGQASSVEPTVQLTFTGEFISQTATTSPTSEPILSAQLKQLIASSETETLVITQSPNGKTSLADLNSLTSGLGLSGSKNENQGISSPAAVTPGLISPDSTASATIATAVNPMNSAVAGKSQTDTLLGLAGKNSVVGERTGDSVSSLRHELQGQFTEARLEQKLNDGSDNQSTSSQDPKGNSQATLAGPTLSSTTGELTSTFAQQVSLGVQDPSASQVSTTASKSILLPSGTMVPEESVMQQVIDRFQLSPRLQENRINISLHPAELGALKIELTMREGVIRANVVAQSQQVQEVLEKNMPRLKAILEGQGFTVENLQVSTESSGLAEFDFFQQQFSREQASTNFSSQNSDTKGSGQSFDTAAYDTVPLTSSVNIQA